MPSDYAGQLAQAEKLKQATDQRIEKSEEDPAGDLKRSFEGRPKRKKRSSKNGGSKY